MNGITELAKMFKERENSTEKLLMVGNIVSLPEVKIKLTDKVLLSESNFKTTVNLSERDDNGKYINLGKDVIILRQDGNFYVVGVLK